MNPEAQVHLLSIVSLIPSIGSVANVIFLPFLFFSLKVQPRGKSNPIAGKKLEGGLHKQLILPFMKGKFFGVSCILQALKGLNYSICSQEMTAALS